VARLEPEVRDHEPKSALVPGPTGYEAYEAVIAAARAMLRPGGLLALELGWTSETAVRELVGNAGFDHSPRAARPSRAFRGS
jgi:release factor glutamine methyltransferase